MVEAGSPRGPAFATPDGLPEAVQLWLIRHGETTWSKSGQHTGRTDLPLTPAGEAQAVALRQALRDLRPALVLCSPRERAQATARLAGLRVDAIDEDLAEWDYGDYEGLTTHQIRERVPGWTLWTHGVPHGETAEQVTARADRVLRRAADHLAAGPVVLVAHGHICRVMGARWIGLSAVDGGRLALGTAAPSLLSSQYAVPVIDRWNMPNPATANGDSR
ncbi:MAG: phosphoglycerate mutase [Pseudonocardiales bacterium]|jgi:probable phosphoglycerate mutase|nr:phosphoglycerate mutase [Pseudonocardiales bacterium]